MISLPKVGGVLSLPFLLPFGFRIGDIRFLAVPGSEISVVVSVELFGSQTDIHDTGRILVADKRPGILGELLQESLLENLLSHLLCVNSICKTAEEAVESLGVFPDGRTRVFTEGLEGLTGIFDVSVVSLL